MIVGCEKNKRLSDKVTNTQPDTITYSKTQTDIQEDQPNKRAIKKTHDTTNTISKLCLYQKVIAFTGRNNF